MVPENIVTQKVGPLPLVVWVAGGAGVIGLFILMTHKGNNGAAANQTNQISSLAPTEAEAFGTIEQQQQDVTNALTTLGNNQSALGGSLSTLTGIITQQGADNAAAFQSLQSGQQSILQGQTDASSQASNYYNTLTQQLANYFGSMGSSLDNISAGVQNTQAGNLAQMQDTFKQYATAQYGYNASAGGMATPALVLPSSVQDFLYFIENPALANPQYQQQLMALRGYVFYPGGGPSIGGGENSNAAFTAQTAA